MSDEVTDFKVEMAKIVPSTRPVLASRVAPATFAPKPQEAPLLFDSLQDASTVLQHAQERLDGLAHRLLRDLPTFQPAERPGEGGLLATAGKCARNMRARAEHMTRVIELLEEGLG